MLVSDKTHREEVLSVLDINGISGRIGTALCGHIQGLQKGVSYNGCSYQLNNVGEYMSCIMCSIFAVFLLEVCYVETRVFAKCSLSIAPCLCATCKHDSTSLQDVRDFPGRRTFSGQGTDVYHDFRRYFEKVLIRGQQKPEGELNIYAFKKT